MRASVTVVIMVNMLLTMALWTCRLRREVRWLDGELLRTSMGVAPPTASCSCAASWCSSWSRSSPATLLVKSTGRLENYVRVVAELVNVGDGLPQKSDVKYRGVLVGSVDNVVPAADGKPNYVKIDLKSQYAAIDPEHRHRSGGAQQRICGVVGATGRPRARSRDQHRRSHP